jgi:signal transduction histidine kinase
VGRADEPAGARDEDVAQLVALAVHDLQAPLRAVAGMVGLLAHRYRGRLDADADEIVDLALAECERMRVLIDRALDLAQVEGGGLVIEELDLRESVGVAVRALATQVTEAGGTVRADDLPVVRADRVLLLQVIQNLVANALTFGRPGVAPVVEVAAHRVAGAWRITVTDNGTGVPPEHRTRVFRMFERLVTSEAGGGSGMGLAIAERAVHRHGGSIGVLPAPSGQDGSTFWFTLPD